MNNVKDRVYELLWELFKDECLYIQKLKEYYEIGDRDKLNLNQFIHEFRIANNFMKSAEIATILFEILPVEIIIDRRTYHDGFRKDVIFGIIKGENSLFEKEKGINLCRSNIVTWEKLPDGFQEKVAAALEDLHIFKQIYKKTIELFEQEYLEKRQEARNELESIGIKFREEMNK